MRRMVGLVATSLLWSAVGCKEPCVEQPASVAVELTGSRDRVVAGWTVLDQIAPTTIPTVGSLSRDGQQSVLLPLNLSATQARYAFQIDGRPDTLTVRWGTQLRFVSQRCGFFVGLIRPTDGFAARRALGAVDSVFYYGESHASRFVSIQTAILIKLKL